MEDNPCMAKKSLKASRGPRVEVTAMDVQIWKEFPEELMESVIARLPIAKFFRFRSVCQKWNSLLGSPSFLQLSKEVAHQNQPWFIATCNGPDLKTSRALYDPCMKKWHHDFTSPSFLPLRKACAAGGLVCYPDRRGFCFHVGNPLTQSWKKFSWSALGRSTLSPIGSVGMVCLNQDCSAMSARYYKIIWVDRQGQYEVYDSLKKSSCLGRVPANINFSVVGCNMVSIGSVVYLLCCMPDGIISYDVVSGAWKQFLIPAPPNCKNRILEECDGRLLLVGSLEDYVAASISVRVWELQMTTLVWMEVDKMPNSWCSEFIIEKTFLSCFSNKRLLLMSLHMKGKTRICTYDAVSRQWSDFPAFDPPGPNRNLLNGIGFLPCLSASP